MQSLLGGLLKNRQLVADMRRVMVMTLWEQVVGGVVAKKSWPEKVGDGVLTIGVISHAWAEELHLHKAEILARYRQLLGRDALKDIHFHVARRKAAGETDPARGNVVLHPMTLEELPTRPVPGDLLAGISNPSVRDLLAPSFARLRAEREWKEEHGWSRCDGCHRIFHGHACPHCGGRPEAA